MRRFLVVEEMLGRMLSRSFNGSGKPIDGKPIDGKPIDGKPIDGKPIDGAKAYGVDES